MYRLALALGGMTVGEMYQRMSIYEFRGWQLLEKEYGPLHLGTRLERIIGRAVVPFLKDVTLERFLEWPKKPEDEAPATLEGAFAILKIAKAASGPVNKGMK